MSKKKRNIRAEASYDAKTAAEMSNQDTIVHQSEKPENSRMFAVLKTNWLAVIIIAFLTFGALGASLKYLEDSAKREIAKRESNKGKLLTDKEKSEESLLNSINPFLPAPLPNPTPQLSTEYLYSGSKLLAVESANANPAPPADLAVWRPSSGVWYVLGGQGSAQTIQGWGMNNDDPVEGDYDGDGKTDFCVYRKINGQNSQWWILKSSDGGYYQLTFGTYEDKPAQADFDGDGKTDLALFRPTNNTWYILQSSNSQTVTQQFGAGTDEPTPADFDGDGRADVAVWRSSNATYYFLRSTSGQIQQITFGQPGDYPVPGDYDGDGKADAAIWRGGVYQWHILYSSTGTTEGFTFGDPTTDVYVQNDYDGDGKVDRAFWRPSTGVWYIVQSSKRGQPDEIRLVQWGTSGDIPVPAFYRR